MVRGSIVVAGEAVVDLVASDADSYRAMPGGSPANVAVGLARVGTRTHFVARLNSGRFGDLFRRHLTSSGVRLDLAVTTSEPATLAVVSLDDDGAPAYEFYAEGTADWGWVDDELPVSLSDDIVALCIGSVAAFRQPGADAMLRLAERTRGKAAIVVDPNIRPALIGCRDDARRRWMALLGVADVVKASDEDISWLAPGSPLDAISGEWTRSGPALVVVTRGADGAFAVTRSGVRVDVAAFPVDVVDAVGAGDAFTSALVDALLSLDVLGPNCRLRLAAISATELRAVLGRAATAAAITCGRRGADPPRTSDLHVPFR